MNGVRDIDALGAHLSVGLEAAIAAPSAHNSQPWRFRLCGDRIDVLLDRDRCLPTIDPAGREAYMSVGAALLNLRIAILATGRVALTLLQPSRDEPDLLARVTLGGPHRPDAAVVALASAIGKRRTNRRPFRDVEVRDEVIEQLAAAARVEGAKLVTTDPITRIALLSLARTAHDRRHSEVRSIHNDGFPKAASRHHDPQFESAPTIVALYTGGDTPLHWLRAGQAMERVLLTATVRGVSNTPMTTPNETPEIRALLASPEPLVVQLILRLGYGDPGPATPATSRRPLRDVIAVAEPSSGPGV